MSYESDAQFSLFFLPDSLPEQSFCGRQPELDELGAWLDRDPSVFVVHGLGGTGKTELCRFFLRSKRLAESAIWCSLRDSPSLATLAANIVKRYPSSQSSAAAESASGRIIDAVTRQGGILVLDNFEAVLVGPYREEYAQFLEDLAVGGQIRVLVTTRVLPSASNPDAPRFQVLHLLGLPTSDALEFMSRFQLSAGEAEANELVGRLDGNPLAMKLAAELVHEMYGGILSTYLASPAHSLEGVSNLLEEHLHNSSAEENLVMCRLATAREPLTFDLIVAGTVLE